MFWLNIYSKIIYISKFQVYVVHLALIILLLHITLYIKYDFINKLYSINMILIVGTNIWLHTEYIVYVGYINY